MILYGAPVREKIKGELIEKIKKLKKKPVLAIVQVGDREDSNVYIRQKQKFGAEIGAEVVLKNLKMEKRKEGKIEEELMKEIKKLNDDENINGIIVQLPLPEGFDTEKIINAVSVEKDADGLVSRSVLDTIPATARGVMALLDFYKIEVRGKKVAVIGRSKLAGGPITEAVRKRGAEVTVCHRSTENTAQICREADILISAAGKAGLVTKEFVNPKQIVVDVGINKTSPLASRGPLLGREREGAESRASGFPSPDQGEGGRRPGGVLVGDVAFSEVEPIVAAITPVPGGIGLLTVACLFQNLLDLIS